ncbi:hypothetical protein ALC62_06199 [Cyphomyrmex costatus]|uniref:Uncharacterized protein n=1 Tax=Cyphomyrmex costatus TaxID=456900 RepID=A0A195CS23_9HYME|nr:hypothetical protein ALC62_06199 [Cyphomyrmex costatus]
MHNLLNKRMFKVCFWNVHETTKIHFTKYFPYNIIMNFLRERHSRCVPLQNVTLRNILREEGYVPKRLLHF